MISCARERESFASHQRLLRRWSRRCDSQDASNDRDPILSYSISPLVLYFVFFLVNDEGGFFFSFCCFPFRNLFDSRFDSFFLTEIARDYRLSLLMLETRSKEMVGINVDGYENNKTFAGLVVQEISKLYRPRIVILCR